MNLAASSINKKIVTWFLAFILLVGGVGAYFGLGKLEDPTFTIKTAAVYTSYPGASAREVEQEVTDKIESAVQKLGQVDKVRSFSKEGLSTVFVDIKVQYTSKELPQIWDEFRRKITDVQRDLPPGAGPSVVNDDYGDVYGLYFALTGRGFTYKELEDQADFLRRELLLVPGVASVAIAGVQKQSIFVEIPRARLAALGISKGQIELLLQAQNLVQAAGSLTTGTERLRIEPTGNFVSTEEVGNLLLRSSSGALVRLGDIATLTREYQDPPTALMHFNGNPSLGIGISNVEGGNVVHLGAAVKKRLKELHDQMPVGMQLNEIYIQSDTVTASINNFLINLLEAVVIVIAILLVFMGMRSGLLIGGILLLTIAATLIAMKMMKIDLQSISLGALIVALGMLVDNAIVVVDGILIKMQMKEDPVKSAIDIVSQTQWPLMGATLIAVITFAPIGLSPDSTGEFCRSLFQVVGVSLLLSWVLAVTVTPLAGITFLGSFESAADFDPYDTKLYRMYRSVLTLALNNRKKTMLILGGLLFLGVAGFGLIDKTFFPNSSTPMFTVDLWRPQGSTIEETRENVRQIEEFLLKQEETKSVTAYTGQGALRFLLNYTPGDPTPGFGHLIVSAVDEEKNLILTEKAKVFVRDSLPEVDARVKLFSKGTGGGEGKIQARFLGMNADNLRIAGEEATRVMKQNTDAIYIRNTWGERVKVIRPILSESRLRRAGLTRMQVADSLNLAYSGNNVGLYRESDKLIPIVLRLPAGERYEGETLPETPIWSPAADGTVPLSQLTERVDTVAQDPMIYRMYRKGALTIECDSAMGKSGALFKELRPQIESIKLPPGVTLEWGGEYEDSAEAQEGLKGMLPYAALIIVMILVMLFNGFKQTGIILLTYPLSIIGVTAGLLLTGRPFDFMAILGFLSLIGMLTKNGIVLIDQIDLEIREGKEIRSAIIDSSVSRVRPVMMAALTTVLGMIPLFFDVLFTALATTIMFGLTFATILTLVVVPVLYAIFFKAGDGQPGPTQKLETGGND